jgi:predicted phage-related endonuclease
MVMIAPHIIEHKTFDIFTYQSYIFSVNEGYGLTTYLERLAELVGSLRIKPLSTSNAVTEIKLPPQKGESNEVSLVLLKNSGFEHEDEHKRVEGEVPEAVQELIDELVTVKKQLDIYTQREKEIKEQLLATMVARGEDKWQSDMIQVSKVAASVSVSVDSKALKEKYPEVFDECKKESKRKEYVTYKLI